MQPIQSKHQGPMTLWWQISKHIVIQWLLILQTTRCTKVTLDNLVKGCWESFYFEYMIILKEGKSCIIVGPGIDFCSCTDGWISSVVLLLHSLYQKKHCHLKPVYSVINHMFLPWGISLRKQFHLISCLQYSLTSLIH